MPVNYPYPSTSIQSKPVETPTVQSYREKSGSGSVTPDDAYDEGYEDG